MHSQVHAVFLARSMDMYVCEHLTGHTPHGIRFWPDLSVAGHSTPITISIQYWSNSLGL